MKYALFLLTASLLGTSALAADKKIVLIAGKPSHPPGMHEFRAGCLLLQKCLQNATGVTTSVYSNGWPESPEILDHADAVVIYADGGAGNPAIQGNHRKILARLADRGAGI